MNPLRRNAVAVFVSLAFVATASSAVAATSPAEPTPAPARVAAKAAAPSSVEVTRTPSGAYSVTWSGAGRHRVYASTKPGNPSRSGSLVGSSAYGALAVKGLNNDARWYFEVASPAAVKSAKRITEQRRAKVAKQRRQALKKGKKFTKVVRVKDVEGTVAATRSVGLDKATNTRDLGGMRTIDGRSIRWGVLFRSDAMVAPTARDAAVLESMGLHRSIEFRAPGEVASAGANRYPVSVKETAIPLLDASTDALSQAIQAALRSGDPSVVDDLLGDGKAQQIAAAGPIDMIRSEPARVGFGQALRLLAGPNGSPMIFNCTAGKDRTGIFAAVIQRILGVPERAILADYELSNRYRAASNQATYDRLATVGVDLALIRPLLEQDGANLAGMFRAVEEEYGSFDRFLRTGLGLDAATLKALRAKLLV